MVRNGARGRCEKMEALVGLPNGKGENTIMIEYPSLFAKKKNRREKGRFKGGRFLRG